MKPIKFLAVCIAAGAIATAAQADVTVTIASEGYDDFFERCDIDIDTQTSGGIDEAWVVYRIAAGPKGAKICSRDATGAGCNGELAKQTCEEISSVDVYDVSCLAADGTPTDCGAVTVSAGEGLPVPVTTVPAPPPADMKVFGTVSGFDDFFERCDLGFMYAGKPDIRQVDLKVEIPHSAGTAACTFNFGRTGGSGSSCTGDSKFACNAISRIDVIEVSCQGADGEVDCGTVGLGAAEAGLMVDAR